MVPYRGCYTQTCRLLTTLPAPSELKEETAVVNHKPLTAGYHNRANVAKLKPLTAQGPSVVLLQLCIITLTSSRLFGSIVIYIFGPLTACYHMRQAFVFQVPRTDS